MLTLHIIKGATRQRIHVVAYSSIVIEKHKLSFCITTSSILPCALKFEFIDYMHIHKLEHWWLSAWNNLEKGYNVNECS